MRRLPWKFGAGTPFQWNPANPAFALGMNALSFIGPAFERYIVTAIRDAIGVIQDPEVLNEAHAFLRQEALHAQAHRHHVGALVEQYPDLVEVSRELDRRFDALLDSEPLNFHLAYIADIEATFTPLFDMFLRHHEALFDDGDHRVAPLFLWHFVEEIEHRSSALIVYDEVVRNPWYRLRMVPRVFSHMIECVNVCGRGFNRSVPEDVRLIDALEDATVSPVEIVWRVLSRRSQGAPAPAGRAVVTKWENTVLVLRLLRSQIPGHSPAHERTPAIAHEWMARYDGGHDVVDWYGDAGACGSTQTFSGVELR